ncbi:hypothetical protein J0K78_19120 [Halobacillus sp. GSS1]|uniref:hypothetical protein n=1 Tax=Halobacillus sp. GSS1 TaxID=2815919 RepID=UPI001A8D0F2F|nr:hypothetical protein [Halobacillus sp. GSS1]MBN9656383.1 hypothetical protein [Halobacillus sp. GSS1]
MKGMLVGGFPGVSDEKSGKYFTDARIHRAGNIPFIRKRDQLSAEWLRVNILQRM